MLIPTGVLFFGALTVYWVPSSFAKDDKPVASYSYPFFFVGTLGVDFGMFLCARIIEKASVELFYTPKQKKSSIYWLQPGGQKVGDQVFNAFAGRFNDEQNPDHRPYIKSIKNPKRAADSILWIAVTMTMSGFILQFIGARGLHASVTLAWLGSTVIMAVVRAALRSSRLKEDDNIMMQPDFTDLPRTLSYGHELDFFASFLSKPLVPIVFDLVTNVHSQQALSMMCNKELLPGMGSTILKTRKRLAELTGPDHLAWDDFAVRKMAQQLKITIESIMESLRSLPNRSNTKVKLGWSVHLDCSKEGSGNDERVGERHMVYLMRTNLESRWRVSLPDLEAILGIWTWSLVQRRSVRRDADMKTFRILCSSDGAHTIHRHFPEPSLWIPRATLCSVRRPTTNNDRCLFIDASKEDYDPPRRGFSTGTFCYVSAETECSVLELATQDVFVSFLSSVLGKGKDIPLHKALDTFTKVLPSPVNDPLVDSKFFIQNSEIERWVQSFEDNSLGSRDDALMCILSVYYEQGTSRVHGGLQCVQDQLADLKDRGQFRYAISMLDFLYDTINPTSDFSSGYRKTFIEFLSFAGLFDTDPSFTKTQLDVYTGNKHPDLIKQLLELMDLATITERDTFEKLIGCSWPSIRKAFPYPGIICGTIRHDRGAIKDTAESPRLPRTEDTSALTNLLDTQTMATLIPHSPALQSALQWAASRKQRILFYLLLDKGHAIETRDEEDMTYLMWASKESHEDVIELLLDENADIEAEGCNSGLSPLNIASQHGHASIARILISGGAEIETKDDDGCTPLHNAAKNGSSETVKVLLEAKAEIDAADVNGSSPLMYAARESSEVVKLLLEAGSEVNKKDDLGLTPLMYAMNEVHGVAVLLLAAGARIEETDSHGRTALSHAVVNKSYQDITFMIERGANLEAETSLGKHTPFLLAASSGHIGIMNLLISNGANIHAKDQYGVNGVMYATSLNHHEAVHLLLMAGLDTEERNVRGETALMYAVKKEHHRCVEVLLKMGARKDARDNEGNTALDLGARKINPKVLEAWATAPELDRGREEAEGPEIVGSEGQDADEEARQ